MIEIFISPIEIRKNKKESNGKMENKECMTYNLKLPMIYNLYQKIKKK